MRRSSLPCLALLVLVLLCLLIGCTNKSESNETDTVPPVTDEEPITEPETAPAVDTTPSIETESPTEPLTLPVTDVPTEPETAAPFDPSAVEPAEMPRLDIVTGEGRGIDSKDVYTPCTVTLSLCDETYTFDSLPAGIRLRGNSTMYGAKRPYRLKFDEKQGLLGLNDGHKFKSWCLMADYYDASMLRTYGTFRMADTLLDGYVFSSDCAHVEVYVNGSYQGVYLLCEQSQIKKHRINIDELDDGDSSVEQGYLLIGQGGRFDEPGSISVPANVTVTDHDGRTMNYGNIHFALSGGDYTDDQKAYCANYIGGVFKVLEAALYQNEYYSLSRDGTLSPIEFPEEMTDKDKQIAAISAVFDIEACVRLCILDEIIKNLDAMTFNMYVDLSPEGTGILTLAAPWDFDFAMANTKYDTLHSPLGYYATNLSASDGVRVNLFYVMFGSIGWFEDMIREVWAEKLPALQEDVRDLLVESVRYDAAFDRDWATWSRPTAGTFGHHCMRDLVGLTDHMESAYFVYNWLTWRLRWLDSVWGDSVFDEEAYRESLSAGEQPDPNAQPIVFDLCDPANEAFLSGFAHCWGTITENGLLVEQTEGNDPQFYLDPEAGGLFLKAKDYPYLLMTFRIPDSNQIDTYITELFLCTGAYNHAVGGVSTAFAIEKTGDDYVTVRVNLRDSGYWSNEIHRIRVDYFTACESGDVIWISRFELTNKE